MELAFELYHYSWTILLAAGVTVYILAKKKKLTVMEFFWVSMFILKVRSVVKRETGSIQVTALNPETGVYSGKIQSVELSLLIEFVYTNDGFEFRTINLPDELRSIGVGDKTAHYTAIATTLANLSIPHINKLKKTFVDMEETDKG